MTKIAFSKATKNCNEIFWIGNDPPPLFGNFPEIHPFWYARASLRLPLLSKDKDGGKDYDFGGVYEEIMAEIDQS